MRTGTEPLTEAEVAEWRIGRKVPLNVYCGARPVCQCHNEDDAVRIVAAMNENTTLRRVAGELAEALRALRGEINRVHHYVDIGAREPAMGCIGMAAVTVDKALASYAALGEKP
jgi:hypothetical protein